MYRYLFCAVTFLLTFPGLSQDSVALGDQRPNILFIFSDDHAQAAISAYGSKVNTTPHLDRLATEGARFLNSFVTNSICTPSRATLLTGQYSHQTASLSSTASMGQGTTSPSICKPPATTPG